MDSSKYYVLFSRLLKKDSKIVNKNIKKLIKREMLLIQSHKINKNKIRRCFFFNEKNNKAKCSANLSKSLFCLTRGIEKNKD